MDDRIVWKEAKSHRVERAEESEDEESLGNQTDQSTASDDQTSPRSCNDDSDHADEGRNQDDDSAGATNLQSDEAPSSHNIPTTNVQSVKSFSHHQINLSLRRNITKLADPGQHKPKPNYVGQGQGSQSFDQWIDGALVAISPSADIILFSGQSPEKMVFIAKLRMEPVNQYVTKALDIPLDYDEQVTSLLCLPIMSTQRTALGAVDWTALVVGLSSGYIKFYTEQSICLLSLKFCDEPVISIKLQTQRANTNARSQTHFATIVDELFIAHRSNAIVIDGIGLYENLRISKEDVVKNKLNYEPAYNLTNLPTILTCQRWRFEETRDTRILDADLLGMRSTSRFDTLKSNSINYDHIPPKACTRTLVLVGRNPVLACYKEAKENVSISYTEMIGSLLPFWSKPQQSRVQINDISCSSGLSLFDKGRLATSIVPSPDKRLAAMTDDFGRVMLIDVTNWLVVRIWKGYRNAQCGWVEVKRDPEEQATPYASFLVIYAPKRGLLEVWSAQRGPRVAAFNVGKSCRLLYAGHRMLNMRAEAAGKSHGINLLTNQSYSHNCYLLNTKSETVFAIELPYTYSLYKYGDLKSRDRLLINELASAVQNDAEVSSISEIIQRMALAESLQVSIHKLTLNAQPSKIVPILENLIIKIMKEYDNHAGETMSNDDQSIVELCKRIIRLCSMFNELSESGTSKMSLPEVNQRLIEHYDEHPKEVDEFAHQLGWDASEVLRSLSLMALERSFSKDPMRNPWPNMGEPLTWSDFVSCFDLERLDYRGVKRSTPSNTSHQSVASDKITIQLKSFNSKFLTEDRIIKTSVFMYNKLSERFYRLSANSPELTIDELKEFNKWLTHLEPSSRLVLFFQFWLSTGLCNHWKMWPFLQQQVGIISDELRVSAMATDDNELIVESWKRIYNLIMESDNIFAAIIATAAIRSDTLRMISDNEKREKLEREDQETQKGAGDKDSSDHQSVDWECLCVDAERMSIFSRQLEDVFLLALLLRYSPNDRKLVDKFVYRVPRISVANIIRAGPSVVSELVAQWLVQTGVEPKVFTQSYGESGADRDHDEHQHADKLLFDSQERSKLFALKVASSLDSDEHTKELLHHVKTSFPHSLDADVLLLNCIWEFCNRWASSQTAEQKKRLLERAYDCLTLLSEPSLRHNAASWAYKTFFQRTFERLAIMIETNSTLLSPKCLRSRDLLARRELNMGESCLDDFVSFCLKLSDFMLDSRRNEAQDANNSSSGSEKKNDQQVSTLADGEVKLAKLRQRLAAVDEWWSTPSVARMLHNQTGLRPSTEVGHIVANGEPFDYDTDLAIASNLNTEPHQVQPMVSSAVLISNRNSLVSASLSSSRLFDVEALIELNRLATLMALIFKLKIIKTYPLSIIGEESRQTLRLDLQQSPASGADMKTRSGLLIELRQRFARKCIVGIVAKITDESNEFDCEGVGVADGGSAFCDDNQSDRAACREDIDTAAAAAADDADDDDGDGKQVENNSGKAKHHHRARQGRDKRRTASGGFDANAVKSAATVASGSQIPIEAGQTTTENSESMALFTYLLSLTCEWQIDSDELHLELVFELYRCNQDKLAALMAQRTRDKQTLANGLLKIASQRALVLFGLSPQLSAPDQWRKRADKWSLFQPNVASWLKSIQEEETRHEIGQLSFPETVMGQARADSLRGRRRAGDAVASGTHDPDDDDHSNPITSDDFEFFMEQALGLRLHALAALADRTKLVLETVTNYLDGQANRLAYDLLQLLESRGPKNFLASEKKLWSKRRRAAAAAADGQEAKC